MDLWWKLTGYVRVRLISADPARVLGNLSKEHRLEAIRWVSVLCVEFSIARGQLGQVQEKIGTGGDRLEILGYFGAVEQCRRWRTRPLLVLVLAVLLWANFWIPSRVLFIRVEGNGELPERKILEVAAECGVAFGASRRDLRSEVVKNELLSAMPELAWAGVNTRGCVATITVRTRSAEPVERSPVPGNLIASRDAVVTECTVTSGMPLCKVGQAVRKGDVLISGYEDLGLCTSVQAAQGEVYGQTRYALSARMPEKNRVRSSAGETFKKYSLIFGKKRINLFADSGILHTTCGKMTKVHQLCLPGGWKLPVYWVVEIYTEYEILETNRAPDPKILEDAIRRQVLQDMIAGEILLARMEPSGDGCRMSAVLECREMIGRQSSGVFLEGDTNDDGENDKRGAG